MPSASSQSYVDVPPPRAFFATPPHAVTWTPPQGVVVPAPPSSRMKAMLEPGSWGVMPPVAMVFGALMAVIFHFGFVVTPPRVAFARAAFARAAAAAPAAVASATAKVEVVTIDQPPAADKSKSAGKKRRGTR